MHRVGIRRKSGALALYLGFTSVADGWAARKLRARLAEGKEDPDRIDERFGRPKRPRPAGRLAWFHAASVGESLSILELLRQMCGEYPDLAIVVTTGTRSAAALLDARLPRGVIHQYVPVDTKAAVRGFLDHWKPDLAIWTESEFWPRLMVETARRGTPMLLVNGRITEKTRQNWRWFPAMSRSLLHRFALLLVQTDAMRAAFLDIGAPKDRMIVTGSLKEGAVPLPHDEAARKEMLKAIGRRPVWLAASTHDGEEEIVIAAHRMVLRRNPEAILILVPRHPERAGDVRRLLEGSGLKFAQRSAQEEIGTDTDIYLADTLGELGLWYRIAPVSFVAGSLVPVGGHNPFEPAALGSAIIHGPHVYNFADIYTRLFEGKAVICVRTEQELAEAVDECLHADTSATMAAAAWEVSSEGAGVTEHVMAHIRPYIDGLDAS